MRKRKGYVGISPPIHEDVSVIKMESNLWLYILTVCYGIYNEPI